MATIPESHQDLLGAEFATLATIGTSSHPQISEVWFLAEDGTVRISLNTARQKTKNLLHNPACTLFILDLANPYRYLELRSDAEVNPDADYQFADKVGAKYGSDLRAHDKTNETRVVVTLDVIKVNAVDMRA